MLEDATTGEVALICNMIKEGYGTKAQGAWGGTEGITSSDAKAHPNNVGIACEYITSGTYAGDLIVAAAIEGDTNLDGVVNSKDKSTLLAGWGKSPANGVSNWAFGDLNYDGIVDGKDTHWCSATMAVAVCLR